MWSPNELLKIEKQRDILSYITLQFFHFKKVPLEHCPFAEVFSFTERETEVFDRLVNTEDSIQAIAESLYISRRTLERYISAIYEKTGVRSRIGLLKLYNK